MNQTKGNVTVTRLVDIQLDGMAGHISKPVICAMRAVPIALANTIGQRLDAVPWFGVAVATMYTNQLVMTQRLMKREAHG